MENLVQSPTHYVWEVSGKPVSIHLDFNVVDRMAMNVMKGFGAVPRRGAEVGGLLLGSIQKTDRLVVRIEEFVPVTCDYLRGPSYLLTEKDGARFSEAVERAKKALGDEAKLVGLYRSHTRDGLALADEDIQLFNQYCGDLSQVILLVRPFATKSSTGAFFFQENGSFRRDSSYQEFSFKRRDLGGGTSLPVRSLQQDSSAGKALENNNAGPDLREWVKRQDQEGRTQPQQAEMPQPVPPTSPAQFRSRWVWIPLSLVFLVIGLVVGFQAALMLNKGELEQIALGSLSVGLSAQIESGKIVVRWDRRCAAVQNALNGTLRIQDGDYVKTVHLDSRQLQNGSVIYMSADNRVSFRLEVTTQQKTVISETVIFVPTGLLSRPM